MIKIISWNVNSINARLEAFHDFCNQELPDICLLQETKCTEEKFPKREIEDLGFYYAISGQKSYNGVAILSKYPIEDINMTLPLTANCTPDDRDLQARYIDAFIRAGNINFRVVSAYIPNGKSVKHDDFLYKLRFYKRLKHRYIALRKHDSIVVAGGDYNVALENHDVYNVKYLDGDIGFHIDERRGLRSIINSGFLDSYRLLHPDGQAYSWWDYRTNGWEKDNGMRIDQLLISGTACDLMKDAGIYKYTRGWERPSDHVPIYCVF